MSSLSQVQVWEDSKGVLHRTEADALLAEEKYAFQKEVEDIKRILLRKSRSTGNDRVPLTVDVLAEVAILAFAEIKQYYEDKNQ